MGDAFDIQNEEGARLVLVECPSCKQPGFLEVWPMILSTRDEHPTELLLGGDLFKYRCPVCDETTTFAYDCLYHDVAHRTFLLFSSGQHPEQDCCDSLDKLAVLAERESPAQLPPYQKRIALTPFEFYEKARILDHNYDDRVIELMKVALKRGMLRDGIIGPRDTLVYERTNGDLGISFIVFGEIPGDVVGVPKGYEYLKDYLRNSKVDLSGEYRFDSAWANRFLP